MATQQREQGAAACAHSAHIGRASAATRTDTCCGYSLSALTHVHTGPECLDAREHIMRFSAVDPDCS